MKKEYRTIGTIGGTALLGLTSAASASAMSFTGTDAATNITIHDGTSAHNPSGNAGATGYTGTGTGAEDQETEPGTARSQHGDRERVFLDGYESGMAGGYDFVNGYDKTDSGDIFLSTDDDYASTSGNHGYEYVLDPDFNTDTYKVYQLDSGSTIEKVTYASSSNPCRYHHGDNSDDLSPADGSFVFTSGVTTDFDGGTHYALTDFDLSLPGASQKFYSHFTMTCGNDTFIGKGQTPVPEPATLFLFGAGIAGLTSRRSARKR